MHDPYDGIAPPPGPEDFDPLDGMAPPPGPEYDAIAAGPAPGGAVPPRSPSRDTHRRSPPRSR
ncbi:hypothetical protein ACFQXA_21095 [Nocardiopsis composta]